VWVFVTLLPTLLLNSSRRDVPLGLRDYVGWSVWALGFITQAVADQQKWFFKRDPHNAVSLPIKTYLICPTSQFKRANLGDFLKIKCLK